jgi:hypothetical protein
MADHLQELEELSIPGFVQLLRNLARENEEDDGLDQFTHVALTGRHPEHGTQIVLNGQGNVLSEAQSALVDQMRDYDLCWEQRRRSLIRKSCMCTLCHRSKKPSKKTCTYDYDCQSL